MRFGACTSRCVLMDAGLAGNAEAYRQLLEAAADRLRAYFARRAGADCADLEDLVQENVDRD